ncbi:MAG: SPOR domain-containing protein [Candidatus Latescibacterota bacterium]|nr:SPOR domain-containing protein [Candidatus Latescibacterota bacterium]
MRNLWTQAVHGSAMSMVLAAGVLNPPQGISAQSRIREEFDPEPYRHDLLLIRPVFGPPPVESTPPEAQQTDLPMAQLEAPPFWVQIMALSQRQTAESVAEDLRHRISDSVRVMPLDTLFSVQAGGFEMEAPATALQAEISALAPEYTDAYVWEAPEIMSLPVASIVDGESEGSAPEDPEAVAVEVELVRTIGWRVLLGQFPGHEEAMLFRTHAARQLGLEDVDIKFQEPWYKVVAGNFRSDRQAQSLVERAHRLGYLDAMRIRDEVFLPTEETPP